MEVSLSGWILAFLFVPAVIVSAAPVFWTDGAGQYLLLDQQYAFDVQPPATKGSGISLTTGSAAFVQNQGSDPYMGIPNLGGPYDLDPADYPNPATFLQTPSGGAPGRRGPSGLTGDALGFGRTSGNQPSFDVAIDDVPHVLINPLNNQASGTVINTGSALKGALNAAGQSNTRTGPLGSSSIGTGLLTGQGIGLSGTQVNSGSAGSAPGGLPGFVLPGGATSSNVFLNTLSADKGKIAGNSQTNSRTGPGGSAFGQSSGTASGVGKGVQLTQVANSDSQGASVPAIRNPWNRPAWTL